MRARGFAVIAGLLATSIDGGTAGSQPNAGSADPGSPGDDDDDATGSGSAVVAPANPNARSGWLKEHVGLALSSRPALARAKIAYYAIDLSTGQVLVEREPDKGLNLASNAKLLTSVAALRGLGSGFRWKTSVYAMKLPDETGIVEGDLYIKGRGDPLLSVDAVRSLAHEVAARGVHEVTGKLVVDTTYFDNVTEPPHFTEQPNEVSAFRAPVASFGVARSSYTVTVLPQPEGKAKVTVDPPLPEYLRLAKSEVTSITEGGTKLRLEAKPKRDQISLELTGTIRTRQGSWDLHRRVDDPARFAAEVFIKALAEQGVKLKSRTVAYAAVPAAAKPIASHESATLAEVLRSMNKYSDNYVAECVLKTLGAETKAAPNATWSDGTAAVRAKLSELGMTGPYRADNGSGLFAATEVSAKQLVGLLAAAHKDYRIGPDLVASLPIGGLDGTLAKRWKGKPAAGRIRAKTGTLDRVVTLAGYIGVDGGHLIAFAILANDIPGGQRGNIRAMADDMVDVLAAYLDAR